MDKKVLIPSIIVLILAVLIGISFVITLPYNVMEKYTESEPYTVTETYTEKEPYTVTEYDTVSEPYADTECEQKQLVYRADYTKCQGEGILGLGSAEVNVKVDNLDNENGGSFSFWIGFTTQDGNRIGTTKSSYIQPSSSVTFAYTYDGDIDKCQYDVTSIPSKTVCKDITNYKQVQKPKSVTKYRDVEKTKEVTKYKDVEKERISTKHETLWQKIMGNNNWEKV